MSDITNVFKAVVKAVRAKEKAQGVVLSGSEKHIFPSNLRVKSDFAVHAQEVVLAISRLRDFLLEHRKDYLDAKCYLNGESSKLTDRDRDQIDANAELYIKKCSESIARLKSQAHTHKVLPQVKEHRDAVLELVEASLKGVCHLYSEQQAIRVKKTVDRKRLSRLEAVVESKKTMSSSASVSEKKPSRVAEDLAILTESNLPVSEEEEKLLLLENEQMYDEMSSMVDEVRQIEGKIVEIARLQEIFAEKVLEQDKDVNKIADALIGTTENIKDGNEQIRQAMKNNTTFRIWILFVLIVITLTLLFLDWYNA